MTKELIVTYLDRTGACPDIQAVNAKTRHLEPAQT